ncbi:HAD-IA family hydrolase [Gymnodinialimonas ceratoperidinii]|uniref:HAD-IA family hydrolase n=1 Tax=Gymnodinialimonas ceratoperidinii TaxID=2856823 RepID=A0A8F6YCR3_9RHOB|nr:HAD-IA family hydrolase [Gymnodinialimonas ceratoperidinii]QXT39625.1 HAD-IA family hydrolase [Gymnodinialimonas ceratoperidinii]
MTLRLVIFDVDGTLVDSQGHIVASMEGAFGAHGLPTPTREAILSIVGLSLPEAFVKLVPDHVDKRDSLTQAYKDTFVDLRATGRAQSPLYPGAAEVLAELATRDDLLLGVATGKSRRGLDHLIEMHGWEKTFQTLQVADHHPSKPHPSMVETCLAETGVAAADAVMVGDTSYDMEMARGAGVRGLGVGWGYHADEMLTRAGAVQILRAFPEMPAALETMWEVA